MENREIKFRIWDNDKNGFHYLNGIWNMPDPCYDGDIQQFTGLKDKNGKEIYEGNILIDSDNSVYVVEWEDYDTEEDFGNGLTIIGWNIRRSIGFPARSVTFKVIGNIYENPKLLSKLKE